MGLSPVKPFTVADTPLNINYKQSAAFTTSTMKRTATEYWISASSPHCQFVISTDRKISCAFRPWWQASVQAAVETCCRPSLAWGLKSARHTDNSNLCTLLSVTVTVTEALVLRHLLEDRDGPNVRLWHSAEAEGLGRLTERVPNVRPNFGRMLCARMKQRLLLVSALSLPKPLASFGPSLVTTQTWLVHQTPVLAVSKSDVRSKNPKLCKFKKTVLEKMVYL